MDLVLDSFDCGLKVLDVGVDTVAVDAKSCVHGDCQVAGGGNLAAMSMRIWSLRWLTEESRLVSQRPQTAVSRRDISVARRK